VRARVVAVPEDGDLPFPDAAFDLVGSRHPTGRRWDEVARVPRPGGRYLSQGVGSGSNRVLYEFLMGPQPDDAPPAVHGAAVVHFPRTVVWTVPGVSAERYRDRLRDLHRHTEREGRFVVHSQRHLIEARREA